MKWLFRLLVLPPLALVLFNVYVYGSIISYRAVAPHHSAFMTARMAEFRREGRNVALDYRWRAYPDISANLKKALIASEDAAFAEHSGFDWNGIRNAINRNEKSGKIKGGGSTISQQLAKNLFLSEWQSYIRKGEEAAITAMLEATTDKDRIFELYLNVIEWDYGVYGAQAAAQRFFHTDAARLSKAQAAQLAARVPAPLRYADNPSDPRLRSKTNIILRRMGSAALPE